MAERAQLEIRTISGREVKLHWKSPRFQEWLAWCYLPGANMLPSEGVGFEARAATAEAAKTALIEKVEAYLESASQPN